MRIKYIGSNTLTTSTHGRSDNPSLAIGFCIIAMTLFSVQDALIKWLTGDYWLMQLLFFRSLVVAIGSGLFIFVRQGGEGFVTNNPGQHLLRTGFNFFAFVFYYFAVTMMPLANASSIALAAPLFMVALSGPMLGEPAGIRRHLLLIVGFLGVLIVIQPTADNLNLTGSVLALGGALMFAMLAIQTRKMSRAESSELMVFYASLAFLLVTGLMMLYEWTIPDLPSLIAMLTLGCVTLFAQYMITRSFQYARVHVIAPFEYLTIFWAVVIGWYFFSEIPGWNVFAGAALIVLAGIGIIWFEKSKSVAPARPFRPD